MSARTPIAYIAVAGFCILLHNAVMIIGDALGMALGLAVLVSFVLVATMGVAAKFFGVPTKQVMGMDSIDIEREGG